MSIDPDLIKYIVEARKRGFSNPEIKAPLFEKGWLEKDVDKAFNSLKEENKINVEIALPESIVKIVEKRAKKNMLSLKEQIEDIVRRSAVNAKLKKVIGPEKIDDLLVSIFSRRKRKTKEKN